MPASNKAGRMAGYAIVYFYPGAFDLRVSRTHVLLASANAAVYSLVASPFYYCELLPTCT